MDPLPSKDPWAGWFWRGGGGSKPHLLRVSGCQVEGSGAMGEPVRSMNGCELGDRWEEPGFLSLCFRWEVHPSLQARMCAPIHPFINLC